MRIVFDARTAGTGRHGIARMAGEIAKFLPAELPSGWQLQLLRLAGDADAPASNAAPAAGAGVIRCRARPYSLAEQWEIPCRVRQARAEIYHLPTFWGPLAAPAAARILSVYDLIHPLYYGRARKRYSVLYRHGVSRLARSARIVVTASHAAARDIVEYFRLPPDHVRVIVPGADHIRREDARAPSRFLEPGAFLMAIANSRAHKNAAGVLDAYGRYRTITATPLPLVLVGGGGAGEGVAASDGRAEIDAGGVLRLSSITDGELRWLFENARLGLFLSLCEGFDLPLLEALACSCPVLASDIPAHRELVGVDRCIAVHDSAAIARRICDLAGERRGADLGSASAQDFAARFTWRESARAIVSLWREIQGDNQK